MEPFAPAPPAAHPAPPPPTDHDDAEEDESAHVQALMALACASQAMGCAADARQGSDADHAAEGGPADPAAKKKKVRNPTRPENKGKGRLFGRDWQPEEDKLLLKALAEFYVPEDGIQKRPWKAIHAKYFAEGSPYPRGVDEMRNRERRIREAASKPFDPLNPPTRCGRVGCNLPKKGHSCLNPDGRWMTKEERKRAAAEANAILKAQAEGYQTEGGYQGRLLSTNGPESAAAAAAGLHAAGIPDVAGLADATSGGAFSSTGTSVLPTDGGEGGEGGGGGHTTSAQLGAPASYLGAMVQHTQGPSGAGDAPAPRSITDATEDDDRAAARSALLAFAKAFAEAEAARSGDDCPPPPGPPSASSSATSSIAGDTSEPGASDRLSPFADAALSPSDALSPSAARSPSAPAAVPPVVSLPAAGFATAPAAWTPALPPLPPKQPKQPAELLGRLYGGGGGGDRPETGPTGHQGQPAGTAEAKAAAALAPTGKRGRDEEEVGAEPPSAPQSAPQSADAGNDAGLTPPLSRRPRRAEPEPSEPAPAFGAAPAAKLTLASFPPGTLVFTPRKGVDGGGSFCRVLLHDAGQLRVAVPGEPSALVSLDFLSTRQEQGLPIHTPPVHM
jgi:hypothetical protein